MKRSLLVLCLVLAQPARADEFSFDAPPSSYAWDGGAIPFLYLPLAANIATRAWKEPPEEPRWFSKREGGRHYPGGQYPTPMLYVDAGLAGALVLFAGDRTRWYHLKGFLQNISVASLLTGLAKNTFGRHRPMFELGVPVDAQPKDNRRSFWSGHSSMTLATATYLGVYARQHIFTRWRDDATLPWWEAVAYVGLAAGAVAVPYSQYALNRHHASDVITGALVGAATATVFYIYQEHRARDQDSGDVLRTGGSFAFVPALSGAF